MCAEGAWRICAAGAWGVCAAGVWGERGCSKHRMRGVGPITLMSLAPPHPAQDSEAHSSSDGWTMTCGLGEYVFSKVLKCKRAV